MKEGNKMKDFFKWLGINDKVAKVAIWLLIIMAFLIVTNAMLESIGAPYYKITIDNLSKINYHKAIDYLCSWIMTSLNFLSIVLLVFRTKEIKKISKFVIPYLFLNYIAVKLTDYAISQVFIISFIVLFCFFYSKKNWKYIFYSIGSIVLNVGIQSICYLYKARFIEFSSINQLNKLITGIDYYVLMTLIILGKEIYMKKRRLKQ